MYEEERVERGKIISVLFFEIHPSPTHDTYDATPSLGFSRLAHWGCQGIITILAPIVSRISNN